jgi:kinesin family protein 5
VLSGASEVIVNNIDDIMLLLKQGELQKRKASTAMNDRSTRAHSVFIISLKQHKIDSDVTIQSKMFLADLGGSEQVKKSQVESGVSRKIEIVVPSNATEEEKREFIEYSAGFELGERMRETVYINLGLLALKKCIEALNNKLTYVPYKDSKLTMLLSAGLGGDSKTSIIICGHMDPIHSSETMAALRFGEKCSLIEMEIRNNATVLAGLLNNIDGEITQLEIDIKKKEKWVNVEEHRVDELAEEGTFEAAIGGKERRLISVLQGAESERKRLGQLLIQREQLLGCSYEDDKKTIMSAIAEETKLSTPNVIGFGRGLQDYDIGITFDPSLEEKTNNVRFAEDVDDKQVPMAVRAKGKKWSTDVALDPEKLKKREKANRTRWAYAGYST